MNRETLKCPSCGLNQFVNAAETCKRCHEAMRPPVYVPARPAVVFVPALRTPGRPEKDSLPRADEIRQLATHLSNELKSRRTSMVNMSQRSLARRMGCNRTYVSKAENDQAQPTIPTLQRFAAAFGVPIWQILKNAEEAMHKEAR